MVAGAVGWEACAGVDGFAEGGATGRVAVGAGAGVARTGTGARSVGVELVAAFVVAAGLGAGGAVVDTAAVDDDAEGELGDGLKLSKLEFVVPAGSVSFAAAGRGALGTAVDLRPRL